MIYTVYFEIFGKKLKTTIEADSREDAKYKIMGAIKWHKVTAKTEYTDPVVEELLNVFGMKK